jgi:hypothetical protein
MNRTKSEDLARVTHKTGWLWGWGRGWDGGLTCGTESHKGLRVLADDLFVLLGLWHFGEEVLNEIVRGHGRQVPLEFVHQKQFHLLGKRGMRSREGPWRSSGQVTAFDVQP